MRIIIVGAGGFGKEILDTVKFINEVKLTYDVLGFVDTKIEKGTMVNGVPVLGGNEMLDSFTDVSLVIGFADPHHRKHFFEQHKDRFDFPVIIHPTAIISEYAEIGSGSIVQAFCIVATNSIIGNCVVINARSGVGHDSYVGSYTSIQSFCDITGKSKVGSLCFFGTGVKLIPELTIASETYLCAGTVVFKDIVKKSMVLGNPGKIIS